MGRRRNRNKNKKSCPQVKVDNAKKSRKKACLNERTEDRNHKTQSSLNSLNAELNPGTQSTSSSSGLNGLQYRSVEHKVLYNDLIISKIFNYLDFKSIETSAKVCQNWSESIKSREFTTFNLNIRPNAQIINNQILNFYESVSQKGQNKILNYSLLDNIKSEMGKKEFKKIIINSWTSNLDNPEIMNLFTLFGEHVTELYFKGEEPGTSKIFQFYYRQFFHLRNTFTNLQHIHYKPLNSPRLFRAETLPEIEGLNSLESVSIWKYYNEIVVRPEKLPPDLYIFLSSQNVQKIYYFPLQYIHELENLNKVTCVKSIMFDTMNLDFGFINSSEDNLLNLSFLSQHEVQLEEIKIVDCFSLQNNPERNTMCLSIYNKLLKKSRLSLKRLKLQPLAFLTDLVFPRLPNLKSLQICKTNQISNTFFATNFDPSGFPSLKTLDLNIKIETYDQLFNIFPSHKFSGRLGFNSLSKIIIRQNIGGLQLKEIAKRLFPSVRTVEVLLNEETMQTFPFIFGFFLQLKHLEISMRVDDEIPCLDSLFLGITQNTVEMLNFNSIPILEFKELQAEPSVLELTDLTSLQFNLFDGGVTESAPQILTSLFMEYFLNSNNLSVQINTHPSTTKESREVLLNRFKFLPGRIALIN